LIPKGFVLLSDEKEEEDKDEKDVMVSLVDFPSIAPL